MRKPFPSYILKRRPTSGFRGRREERHTTREPVMKPTREEEDGGAEDLPPAETGVTAGNAGLLYDASKTTIVSRVLRQHFRSSE